MDEQKAFFIDAHSVLIDSSCDWPPEESNCTRLFSKCHRHPFHQLLASYSATIHPAHPVQWDAVNDVLSSAGDRIPYCTIVVHRGIVSEICIVFHGSTYVPYQKGAQSLNRSTRDHRIDSLVSPIVLLRYDRTVFLSFLFKYDLVSKFFLISLRSAT